MLELVLAPNHWQLVELLCNEIKKQQRKFFTPLTVSQKFKLTVSFKTKDMRGGLNQSDENLWLHVILKRKLNLINGYLCKTDA